jgi:hypothetical protein
MRMHPSRLSLAFILFAVACGSSDDGGDGQQSGTPTYNQTIQPLLAAKCDPCHTSEGAGGFNHAVDYGATQEPSEMCSGKKVYECMMVLIKDGTMPEDGACSGDPAADADNAACLTSDEQERLTAWIAAGAPEGSGGGQRPDGGDTGDDTGDPGDSGDNGEGGW